MVLGGICASHTANYQGILSGRAFQQSIRISEGTTLYPDGLPAVGSYGSSTYGFRGISLVRNSPPLGPYSRTKPRALWWS